MNNPIPWRVEQVEERAQILDADSELVAEVVSGTTAHHIVDCVNKCAVWHHRAAIYRTALAGLVAISQDRDYLGEVQFAQTVLKNET